LSFVLVVLYFNRELLFNCCIIFTMEISDILHTILNNQNLQRNRRNFHINKTKCKYYLTRLLLSFKILILVFQLHSYASNFVEAKNSIFLSVIIRTCNPLDFLLWYPQARMLNEIRLFSSVKLQCIKDYHKTIRMLYCNLTNLK